MDVAAHIESNVVVAVMRGAFPPEVALDLANVLVHEGINSFELTMNSEQPIEAMRALKAEFGDDVAVGMGTVLSTDVARQALDAGADFVVSPVFQPAVVELVQQAGRLMVPGVATPTEAVMAWEMGVPLLKLFPIGALGLSYFNAMFGPLDHMKFMCNGAIDAENAQQFLHAGAVAVGIGGWLTGDGTWTESRLRSRARILMNALGFENPPLEG